MLTIIFNESLGSGRVLSKGIRKNNQEHSESSWKLLAHLALYQFEQINPIVLYGETQDIIVGFPSLHYWVVVGGKPTITHHACKQGFPAIMCSENRCSVYGLGRPVCSKKPCTQRSPSNVHIATSVMHDPKTFIQSETISTVDAEKRKATGGEIHRVPPRTGQHVVIAGISRGNLFTASPRRPQQHLISPGPAGRWGDEAWTFPAISRESKNRDDQSQ